MNYLLIGIFFVVITVMFSTMYLRQDSTTAATQNVQMIMKSADVGTIREEVTTALDKDALATNLALDIAKSYKGDYQDVKVGYVFLDKNGNPTTSNNSKNYDSIQFKVSVLDAKKQEVANSTQRIKLKEIQ